MIKTEEKGSDVNLAAYLLVDGSQKDYEQAIVVSNDSDLMEVALFSLSGAFRTAISFNAASEVS